MTKIHCLVFLMTVLQLDASECSWGVSKMYESYYKDFILHEPISHHVYFHHNQQKPLQHAHNHDRTVTDWTYEDQDEWCNSNEETTCCGIHQSPVRLVSTLTPVPMERFEFINYTMLSSTVKIANNGQTLSAYLGDVNAQVRGGGLTETYNLYAMNFHWGSEHVVNLIRAPLEVQFIHYKSKFPDVFTAVASEEPDALAIIAVFFWIGNDSTEALDTITSSLSTAGHKNAIGLIPPFNLSELLPESTTHFYRYSGSLTSPKCNEVVVWTVFMEPNLISLSQLKKFYELKATEKSSPVEKETAILHNYRKTQELYDRIITIGEETW